MVPEWKLAVTDEYGNPLNGIQVEESWENYTYFGADGFDLRRSDSYGFVVFPARWLWAGVLSRVLSPPLAELGELAHGSSGLSISARVWDPDEKYFSAGGDSLYWYSERQQNESLPTSIVGTKSD